MFETIQGRFWEVSSGQIQENKRTKPGKLYRSKSGKKKQKIMLNIYQIVCLATRMQGGFLDLLLRVKDLVLCDLQNGFYVNIPSQGNSQIPGVDDPDCNPRAAMFFFVTQ